MTLILPIMTNGGAGASGATLLDSESYSDTANRNIYTFSGALDASAAEGIVALWALDVQGNDQGFSDLHCRIGGDAATEVGKQPSFNTQSRVGMAFDAGAITNVSSTYELAASKTGDAGDAFHFLIPATAVDDSDSTGSPFSAVSTLSVTLNVTAGAFIAAVACCQATGLASFTFTSGIDTMEASNASVGDAVTYCVGYTEAAAGGSTTITVTAPSSVYGMGLVAASFI